MGNEEVAIICLLSVLINACLLASTLKMYTEVLKIEHIKGIGKDESR